jgi:hypothetical protein
MCAECCEHRGAGNGRAIRQVRGNDLDAARQTIYSKQRGSKIGGGKE